MDYSEDASFFCMLKGHTYTGLDQSFNTMMMYLRKCGIYSLSVLFDTIFKGLAKYDCIKVIELHALWDWKGYFAPHINGRLGGFATGQFGSGMHEFHARKDSEGKVRLWFRKSSQASSWIPEGPGMLVFDTIPVGEPPLAPYVKSELQWKRNEFEGVLRMWYRFMAFKNEDEGSQVRAEWAETFARLPARDDPNNLQAELKPKWGELPKQSARRAAAIAGMGGATTALENPPINPVTGPGRTGTEVQRETAGYREYIRRTNMLIGAQTPVFLGDYLFVQLPSKPVFLARVTGTCFIDEASADRISITIGEYSHEAQGRVAGFFGTFSKTPNMLHDPLDKRTGGKFIRHASITRAEIVVYDVYTWVDRERRAQIAADHTEPQDCIRVAPRSLRQLASARPEFLVPDPLPLSHRSQDDAESAAAGARARRERDGDDPPPPIPAGFKQVVGTTRGAASSFMIWTKLQLSTPTAWHHARITKILSPNARGGYTHDARFSDGGVRGVRLTQQAYDDG